MSGHFISVQEIAGHFISDQKIAGPDKVLIFANLNGIYLVRINQFHCILNSILYLFKMANKYRKSIEPD